MRIKVEEGIEVGVEITQKGTCPAGTAYWVVDYMVDGVCIHSATTGAIYGNPNPLAMLDREYTWHETHYQDVPDADPKPEGEIAQARKISVGTSGNRPAWFEERHQTHRQAIINSIAQLV